MSKSSVMPPLANYERGLFLTITGLANPQSHNREQNRNTSYLNPSQRHSNHGRTFNRRKTKRSRKDSISISRQQTSKKSKQTCTILRNHPRRQKVNRLRRRRPLIQ